MLLTQYHSSTEIKIKIKPRFKLGYILRLLWWVPWKYAEIDASWCLPRYGWGVDGNPTGQAAWPTILLLKKMGNGTSRDLRDWAHPGHSACHQKNLQVWVQWGWSYGGFNSCTWRALWHWLAQSTQTSVLTSIYVIKSTEWHVQRSM